MRTVLILILQCFATAVYSQNVPLFKVITFSEGVTIGGKPAAATMDIHDPELMVDIPKNGYMGVVLNSGQTLEINRSTKAGKIRVRERITAVHADPPMLVVSPCSTGDAGLLRSDTLFFNWWNHPFWNITTHDTTTVTFINMFEQPLGEFQTVDNYALIDLKDKWGEEKVLTIKISRISRKNQDTIREHCLVKRNRPAALARTNFDLARLPSNEDRLFLEAALYTLDEEHYESRMCVYKIMKARKTASDPILAAFYKRMFDEHNLTSVKLD